MALGKREKERDQKTVLVVEVAPVKFLDGSCLCAGLFRPLEFNPTKINKTRVWLELLLVSGLWFGE